MWLCTMTAFYETFPDFLVLPHLMERKKYKLGTVFKLNDVITNNGKMAHSVEHQNTTVCIQVAHW